MEEKERLNNLTQAKPIRRIQFHTGLWQSVAYLFLKWISGTEIPLRHPKQERLAVVCMYRKKQQHVKPGLRFDWRGFDAKKMPQPVVSQVWIISQASRAFPNFN